MKINRIEGRSGFCKEQEAPLTSSSESFAGGWGLITAKGASSYFATIVDDSIVGGKELEVGMPVNLKAWSSQDDNPLEEGDEVTPWNMSLSCWTTDCAYAPSQGKIDGSSQCDTAKKRKNLQLDGNISDSGSINGLYETESEMISEFEGLFANRIIDGDDKKTWIPIKTDKTYWHWFRTREVSAVGEIEKTIIRRMLIDGIVENQPTSGFIPFNFNYTTLESYQYERKVST